jgi:hypothetical protein
MPTDPPPTDIISVIQAAIKDAAPRLADALTGPDAAIALAALGRALVNDAMATPPQIFAALNTADKTAIQGAEQDTLSRLRKAGSTLDLQARVVAVSTGLAVAALDDTEKARLNQVQTHDSTTRYLAIGVSVAFGLILLALIVGAFRGYVIDGQLQAMIYTLLGVLATAWANIIGFYFGSSVGSLQKSQTLQASLIQQQTSSAGASGTSA